jgi:HK97 family phage portal protein
MGLLVQAARGSRGSVAPGNEIVRAATASPANYPAGSGAGGGMTYAWDGRVPILNARTYRNWYRTSEWIRGAVDIRTSQVVSAEWDVVAKDKDQQYSKRLRRDVRDKLEKPNPIADSFGSFLEPVIRDLVVLDAGCIEKERNLMGELLNLWPVNAAEIRVSATWDGSDPKEPRYFWYPDGYKPRASFRNDEFIYMIQHHQTNTPVGLPAMETLRLTIEAELQAHEYNRRQVAGAAPDGVMDLGKTFTREQVNSFRAFFESEVAGRGAVGFIGGTEGAKWIPLRGTNRDMQFLEWQVYLVRKIAVVFGLTPQDLGVTFDVNKSTSETQIQISEDRGLRPLMAKIQDYITREVVWDPSFGGSKNNLAFRFTSLNLKESTAKSKILESALSGVPWRFINEARMEEGREPIPEMDGKLVMETPVGALDITDVPTVREYLELQQAAKAQPAASKELSDIVALVASQGEYIRQVLDHLSQRPAEIASTVDD